MNRTQVYLDDEDLELLDQATKETGATRSELIRRAIQRSYGRGQSDPLRVMLETAGTWSSGGSGEEFVEGIRNAGLGERLARFGIQ